MKNKVRIAFLLCVLTSVFLLIGYRQEIARFVWHETHVAPEVLLFLSHDAELGVEMGMYYFDSHAAAVYDIEQAETLLENAVAIDPRVADAQYQLARIAFLRSQYELALERMDRHIALHEDTDPQVYYLKGLVQAFAGRPEEALETFEFYYTFDQTSWYVHNNLAWIHFQLGNYDAVDRISEQGLVHNPGNPWLLMNRAVAQFNLGNTDAAIALLDEAEAGANSQTEASWLTHYPGNDPRIASLGLAEFRQTLRFNRDLFHTAQ